MIALLLAFGCPQPGQDRFLTVGPASLVSVAEAPTVMATRFLLPPPVLDPKSEARCIRGEDVSRRVELPWSAIEIGLERVRAFQQEVMRLRDGTLPSSPDWEPLITQLDRANLWASEGSARGCTPWDPAGHQPWGGDLLVVADARIPFETTHAVLSIAEKYGYKQYYFLVRDPSTDEPIPWAPPARTLAVAPQATMQAVLSAIGTAGPATLTFGTELSGGSSAPSAPTLVPLQSEQRIPAVRATLGAP